MSTLLNHMIISPTLMLLYLLLSSSILLSSINSSWFGLWCSLELNMLSFITMMKIMESSLSSEAMMKYFLIQSSSSYILIISTIFMKETLLALYLSISTLMMKLGSAPFHFWLPQMAEGLKWMPLSLLLTIQKIIPMILMNQLINHKTMNIIITFSILSAIIGAIGGMNEISLRKMITFSSINHLSWMLTSMMSSKTTWFIYLMIYSFILMMMTMIFNQLMIMNITQISTSTKLQDNKTILISLLSMGGIPPFMGFFPKLMIIMETQNLTLLLLIMILLTSNVITLYFYMRFNNMNFMIKTIKSPLKTSMKKNKFTYSLSNMMNIMGMFMLLPMWFIFYA